MFSHVAVGCDDLEAAGRFYDAVLAQLDLVRREVASDGSPPALCWVAREHTLPRLNGIAAAPGNGAMTAFRAPSPATVDAAHAAGLAAGGTDEGAPGERPRYGAGYYGAYLRDPGGNKLHIAHRGDLEPSWEFER
jgi:catechol 2,3-dioxygenase-like lactoylglutathione lyase family enzyme